MSRSLNHGFEDKCSEETFTEIYNMAYARDVEKGKDIGRADERKRIKEAIYDFIADEYGKYTGDDRFIVDEWRKELMKINKRLGEIVRGE